MTFAARVGGEQRRPFKGVHIVLLLAAFAAGSLLPYLRTSSSVSAALAGAVPARRPGGAGASATAREPAASDGAAFRQYVGDAAALGDCQEPQLDEAVLSAYGDCRVLRQACFDQHLILVHGEPEGEELPYPIVDFGAVAMSIPGWAELGKPALAGGLPELQPPVVRRNSSGDRADLRAPVFSECVLPFLFAPAFAQVYSEFFLSSFVPLHYLAARGAFDRRITFMPFLDGLPVQRFHRNLLAAYSDQEVLAFEDAASREHMHNPLRPRCFSRAVVCGLKGLYKDRPPASYFDPEHNFTSFDGDPSWKTYQPVAAGQALVEHYRSRGQLPQPPAREPGTLHVVVGNRTGEVRLFRQLPEFLVACNAWVPPPGSGYERAVCRALTLGADDFLEGVAVLRGTDIFIAHHGSELCNGVFMQPGSAVVEVAMKDFPSDWLAFYYPSTFRREKVVTYWQALATSDESWHMAPAEEQGLPWHDPLLERHTVLRWQQWAPILSRVASFLGPGKKAAYEQLQLTDVRWRL